jgi:DNA-binding MarR family transcriptional regulator
MTDGSTPTDALDLCIRLTQAQNAVARRLDRALSAHHGLSFGDYLLLRHLGEAPGGRMRRMDLAAAVGLTPSGVTRALAPLERIGLVAREANPRDARVALTSLTGTGRDILAEVHETAARVAETVQGDAGWSGADAQALGGLLAGLGAAGLHAAP